ncbi:MAG: hypothetical protein ACOH1T_02975 [Microbacteriaceae bacterium]
MTTAADVCTPLRSGSWSGGGVGAFHVSFTDPGGSVARLVAWALDYVSPLNDWLDELTGNEGDVDSFAETWRTVAAELSGYESDLAASHHWISELEGRTARALRKRHDEIREVLTDCSEWSSATAAALELASTIVGAVHDAVVGALSELAGLVTSLFGFTLNPFSKVDDLRTFSNRAQGFIEVIADLIERMFDAFEQLVQLLSSLVPIIAEGLQRLRETLGELIHTLSPLLGPLSGILGGAVSDLLAGDSRVTELNSDDLSPDQLEAWRKANEMTEINSPSDLIRANGYVDGMGGADRSVIDIMEVVDENGETHFVVALPSTQDWGMLKGLFGDDFVATLADYPATNDLDSNIALMLLDNPLLATQYERAVMQAMSDAGVPRGAEVIYSGFSQGGIMAATLASNPNTPFTTIGVVTNGSPIGDFAIPSTVTVMSFEHLGDPVPMLDGQIHDEHSVHLPAPHGDYSPGSTHNNANYVDSVTAWESHQPPRDSAEPAFFSGTVVNHQQHTWKE